MKAVLSALLILAAPLLASALPAAAAGTKTIVVSKAWTRATPPNAPTGVGYLTITNNGSEPDSLVAVKSPLAGEAALHQTRMEDNRMQMRPLKGGIAIPPGGRVELKPGGTHIMLMQLKSSIAAGTSVPIVLSFERAGDVKATLKAAPIGATEPPANE